MLLPVFDGGLPVAAVGRRGGRRPRQKVGRRRRRPPVAARRRAVAVAAVEAQPAVRVLDRSSTGPAKKMRKGVTWDHIFFSEKVSELQSLSTSEAKRKRGKDGRKGLPGGTKASKGAPKVGKKKKKGKRGLRAVVGNREERGRGSGSGYAFPMGESPPPPFTPIPGRDLLPSTSLPPAGDGMGGGGGVCASYEKMRKRPSSTGEKHRRG